MRWASLNRHRIPLWRHLQWFAHRLWQEEFVWICWVGGVRVGTVRYDRTVDPAMAEVSIIVDPWFQGCKVGTNMLGMLAEVARADGIHRLIARVRRENIAAMKLFAKAQYSEELDPNPSAWARWTQDL